MNPWVVTFSVMLATFMEVLDTTVVNVSIPHIAGNLASTNEGGTWLVAARSITTIWSRMSLSRQPRNSSSSARLTRQLLPAGSRFRDRIPQSSCCSVWHGPTTRHHARLRRGLLGHGRSVSVDDSIPAATAIHQEKTAPKPTAKLHKVDAKAIQRPSLADEETTEETLERDHHMVLH
jgi:hypothetical protein